MSVEYGRPSTLTKVIYMNCVLFRVELGKLLPDQFERLDLMLSLFSFPTGLPCEHTQKRTKSIVFSILPGRFDRKHRGLVEYKTDLIVWIAQQTQFYKTCINTEYKTC